MDDRESDLYYCQSRYYDPQIGRFINADAYASTGQGILGNNMFAYCNNNPVNYLDENGDLLKEAIIECVISGIISFVNAAITGETGMDLIDAFVEGFIKGVVCNTTSGSRFLGGVKYAIIIFDVGKAVYECWQSGASAEECALVAIVHLWAALSFDDMDLDAFSELVFGLGLSSCATGVQEGVERKNTANEGTPSHVGPYPSGQYPSGQINSNPLFSVHNAGQVLSVA